MEKNQHISELYRKFLDNTINDEEYRELVHYFGSDVNREQLRELILQALETDSEEKIIHIHKHRIEQTISKVKGRLNETVAKKQPKKYSLLRRSMPYIAAAALVVIGIFSYRYFTQPTNPQIQITSDLAQDVNPGSNKATLRLADGSIYELSEDQDGITIDQNGIRYADGQHIIEELVPSTISLAVPRGGQYKVTLPDGTTVYVNSESLLKYPSQFFGNNRVVELSGEAYFQVAEDKERPFLVNSDGQQIEVLGTRFNLSNYEGEPTITTLLEGSVQIGFKSGKKSVKLVPGQQSVLLGEKITVKDVYAEDYIGWTTDVFILNDVPLTEFMKQLERWYDIEVDYSQSFKDEHFIAEIPRNRKLSEVLSALEKAGKSKFKQQGRRVTVQQ